MKKLSRHALYVLAVLLGASCYNHPKVCPANFEGAGKAGHWFESYIADADGKEALKSFGPDYHKFSELKDFGWTQEDLKIAKSASTHVDLSTEEVRFDDSDIREYLLNERLCPLTINFLFSYMAKKEKRIFLNKLLGRD